MKELGQRAASGDYRHLFFREAVRDEKATPPAGKLMNQLSGSWPGTAGVMAMVALTVERGLIA